VTSVSDNELVVTVPAVLDRQTGDKPNSSLNNVSGEDAIYVSRNVDVNKA
jgi:hypothetical protein